MNNIMKGIDLPSTKLERYFYEIIYQLRLLNSYKEPIQDKPEEIKAPVKKRTKKEEVKKK